METTEAPRANGQSNEKKYHTTNKVNGINNWMLLFFTIFIAHYVTENIIIYGIIRSPIQLTYDFIEFMSVNWWYFAMVLFSYLFQIILSYLNEKGLAMGILSERVGMALHLFIFLFSLNLCSIVSYVNKFNPVAGIAVIAHIFHISLKFWGYALENRNLRKIYKRNIEKEKYDAYGKSEGNGTVKYPDNVNLKNIFQFMVCTAACKYRLNFPPRKPTNYRKMLTGIVQMILIYYASAFMLYQYILPEADKTATYIDNQQYLKIFASALKLTLPVNITWILFYWYCCHCYVPMFSWFWGSENDGSTHAYDWWNSENSTVYWIKWNYQAHMWFKEYVFLPLLQMGYSKRTAGLVVGCVSGFLHEYLLTIPCRCCYGGAIFVYLSQIPVAYITAYAQRNYGAKWGNIVLWSTFIFGIPICVILLCYNYTPS